MASRRRRSTRFRQANLEPKLATLSQAVDQLSSNVNAASEKAHTQRRTSK
jgi:outer membrane murein-binding lipoprotein Lpp